MQKIYSLKHFCEPGCFFGIFIVLVLIDQFFKYKVRHFGGFYLCNRGISFGIVMPSVFFWLVLAIFFLIMVFFLHKKRRFSRLFLLGLIFFASGALSNIIDRLSFGCILDYISFFQKILPVFNLADVAIFIGSCFLFISLMKKAPLKSD